MLFHTELLYLLKITDKNKIMILTGKAKKDFSKFYIDNNYDLTINFKNLPEIYQNTLIIEWFDSVGIYINIENLYYQSWWSYKVKIIPNIFEEKVMVKTRQEAIEQAIKNANEIYNTTL